MIRIRPYKQLDAKYITEWIKTEKDFAKWCANSINYPLTYENLFETYKKFEDAEDGWLFTALDEAGIPVGFFMMTKADYHRNTIHMGFVIVDESRRNNAYGKKMMKQAIKYAFEILCVTRVTLKVFDNNEQSHKCYLNAGFTDESYDRSSFKYKDETWGCYLMSIEN